MNGRHEIFSLRRDVFSEDGRFFPLVYRLLEEGPAAARRYAVSCYVDGVDLDERPYDQAEVDLPCGRSEEALSVMERIASAEVMPVHMQELLDEFLA